MGKNKNEQPTFTGLDMTVDRGGYPPATSPTGTLGDSLRATRVAAGASIEQVEADLRIKSKYIEAIEDHDVAALPSRAYTDGFLRNYATYLGLDPAETVRRFADEQGVSVAPSRKTKTAPIPRPANDPLTGFAAAPPKRGFARSIGKGLVGLWPVIVLAGAAFGGYTGFVAARDAGLFPPEIVNIVRGKTDEKPVSRDVAEVTDAGDDDASEPVDAPSRSASDEQREAQAPAQPEPEETEVADSREDDAREDIVGNEVSTGRPDSLSYARTGNTPYWRAKPPAVEPADGPVSEIEPETAGVLRADDGDDADESPSRWASSTARTTPPADADASRIAAAAREALRGGLTDSAPAQDDPFSGFDNPTPDPAPDSVATLLPNAQPGAEPLVIDEVPADLVPAQPAQAPRRFALLASADTWVQVTDAFGTVTYTGILSPGEAYNIPAQEGLRLKTGNAGGLMIEVDGQRFGPLGNDGSVMRNVVLNPSAVRASFTLSQAASLSQQ